MNKRVTKKSLLNDPVVKAIPLSVALSVLSVGAAFADTPMGALGAAPAVNQKNAILQVQNYEGKGKTAEFNADYMDSTLYKDKVKTALKSALVLGAPVKVHEVLGTSETDSWIDISGVIQEGTTYENGKAGSATEPDNSPDLWYTDGTANGEPTYD